MEWSDHDVIVETSPTSPTVKFKLGEKALSIDFGIVPPRASQLYTLDDWGTSLICSQVVKTKYYEGYTFLVAGSRFDAPNGQKERTLEILHHSSEQSLTVNWPKRQEPSVGCFDTGSVAWPDKGTAPSQPNQTPNQSVEEEISRLIFELERALLRLRNARKGLSDLRSKGCW
jgi:hypothetical protein